VFQDSGVLVDGSNVMSGATQLNVDNIRIDGNTISSTDTNGNINLTPNGTGKTIFPSSSSVPTIVFDGYTTTGISGANSGQPTIYFFAGGAERAVITTNFIRFSRYITADDQNFFGVSYRVEKSTAGSGSPNVITTGGGNSESRKVFTNEGATAANYHTLPSAAAGLFYTFVVQDSDGIRVTANTADTIRVIDSVTATAGYIESTTIGSVVTLVAINATEWIATSIHGVWTDGTFTYDDTGLTT